MPKKKVRKASLYIGTNSVALASETTWTKVEGVVTLGGQIGTTYSRIEATTLDDDIKQEFKGIADGGQVDVECRLETTAASATTPTLAAGQLALKAAADDEDDTPYNIKIELDDNPDPSGDGTPTRLSFQSRIFGFSITLGGNNAMAGVRSTLDIVSTPLIAAANDGA